MSVGSKIKALRLQRGMTQSDLANGVITRSMLCRIEGGSATPSMATLSALAAKLEVAPSFLLEESDDLLPAERARFSKIITKEFRMGNLRTCLELFNFASFPADVEFSGIFVHTVFSIAINEFLNGNFREARKLLQRVEDKLSQPLILPHTVSKFRIAFLRTVMDNIGDLEQVLLQMDDRPDFAFEPSVFFFLLKLLREGKGDACDLLLDVCELGEIYRNYIQSQILIKEYRFIDAILKMKTLAANESCPYFLKLLCFRSMEICCKLCEDYKGAYENHMKYQDFLKISDSAV